MAAPFPPSNLLHHLLLRPTPIPQPPSVFMSIFIRPMFRKPVSAAACTVAVQSKTLIYNRIQDKFVSSKFRSLLFCRQSTTLNQTPSAGLQSEGASLSSEAEEEEEDEETGDYYEEEEEEENEDEDEEEGEEIEIGSENSEVVTESGSGVFGVYEVPSLTVKEKKDLASYAHSLGKKLKSQSVGKSGFNANVATSFMETLEANELLKIKIHRTCPGELEDMLQRMEVATGSVVVGKIGRTVIIYKPSLTKLKAEEKKRQARRIFVRKESQMKPTLLKKAQLSRPLGRSRRGSTRPS